MQQALKGWTGRVSEYHYCVLYTRVNKQQDIVTAIRHGLPDNNGIVFYPCVELWRRGSDRMTLSPLFPGYIFIRSNLKRNELHEIIKRHKSSIIAFVRELNPLESDGKNQTAQDDPENMDLSDLTEDEAGFMDFMLGFMNEDGDCIIHMSYGYKDENDSITVMNGPLKGHEDMITDVNIRQRKAYMDMTIKGHRVKAGLTIKPKRHWFPNDKSAPDVLSDGEEVRTNALADRIMGNGIKKKNC